MTGPHVETFQRDGGPTHDPITKSRNTQIASRRRRQLQHGPNLYPRAIPEAPVASGHARKWQIRNSSSVY